MKRQELVDFIDAQDNMIMTNNRRFVQFVKWENGNAIVVAQFMTTAIVDPFFEAIEKN